MGVYIGTGNYLQNAYIGERNPFIDDYQEVEYIQSSGTQYINTGVINQWTTLRVNIKFDVTQNYNNAETGIFGAKGSSTQSPTIYIANLSRRPLYSWCGSGTGTAIKDVSLPLNTVHTLNILYEINSRHWTYDGYVDSTSLGVANNANNTDGYMCFFSDGSTPQSYSYMKLYYGKITVNGTLVRDFVPCYRKSDNVIGLYDLVNNQFYTNAGTGVFTKGPDVN